MEKKKNTVSFYTLGCRLNQSETATLEQLFEADSSYKIVSKSAPADIYIINTCTVTAKGDSDTRKLINKVLRINPKADIALIGCQSQTQKEKLLKLPNVRWVVGNAIKNNLPEILKETDKSPRVIVPTIPKGSFKIAAAAIDKKRTRANMKVQDGCNFFCSYCEVPYARGRARSRVFDNVIEEAKQLVEAGHKEIVITGINVGQYNEGNNNLLDIINALEQIKDLKRIRISSIEPTTIPEKLLNKMSKETKLCRYLHIPLQSANDQVLASMNRKYKFKEFQSFIHQAKKEVKGICIGTDLIVGFPTETDEYFYNTFEKLQALPVDYFHVFSYSKRSLALSRKINTSIPIVEIQKRSKLLRELSQTKKNLLYKSMLGTTQSVLFEQKKNGFWTGFTDNYVHVKVNSKESLQNQIYKVKLKNILGQDILGILN
ncbi:MAG: tRNA (N(6)-L-threonylcarbamoyladenosine(37)-C(2))-methylthiotransferase MtaB [Candidatus Zapsychrus exili]|nr:tRNA (N(6)-L-threonylcarbamoyladenosine(37)-C(2))-methylthiotransferase MtaB [Candidatus Zapsychrus exili]